MNEIRAIPCEEALRQLLVYLDGELSEPARDEVDAHLKRCRGCWSRAEFERRLKRQLSELRQVTVRPQLERRIRELLHTAGENPGG